MKRFVDLRAAEYICGRFAWWDTCTDRFEEHGGEMAWVTWDDFEAAYSGDDLERYRRLCPPWCLTRARVFPDLRLNIRIRAED